MGLSHRRTGPADTTRWKCDGYVAPPPNGPCRRSQYDSATSDGFNPGVDTGSLELPLHLVIPLAPLLLPGPIQRPLPFVRWIPGAERDKRPPPQSSERCLIRGRRYRRLPVRHNRLRVPKGSLRLWTRWAVVPSRSPSPQATRRRWDANQNHPTPTRTMYQRDLWFGRPNLYAQV